MSRRKGVPMPPWSEISAGTSVPAHIESLANKNDDDAGFAPSGWTEPLRERASTKAQRPLDPEGIPFLTVHDVARDLGITDPRNAKHAAYGEVPHYVDTKSGNLTPTSNNRVWFSMKDIADHFAVKSGAHLPPEKRSASQLAHGPRHEYWQNEHKKALNTVAMDREAGINTGTFENQPDPANKDIHRRLVRGVRMQFEHRQDTGNLYGSPTGLGSNLEIPVKFGSMKPVDAESTIIDFNDPTRPRRGR